MLRVNDLPLHTTFDGRTFEFQLGVSLYDEAYGTFYGNTVYRSAWGHYIGMTEMVHGCPKRIILSNMKFHWIDLPVTSDPEYLYLCCISAA